MDDTKLDADWVLIQKWLPDDLYELAKKTGFFERARGIVDLSVWLRLIFLHVAGGLSLKQAAVRGGELGIVASLSGVALHKRLRRAEKWLTKICQHLLEARGRYTETFEWPKKYRIRVIDATTVQEPGSTGTDYRIHFSIRLPEMTCDHYEITDAHGGEHLGKFKFQKDEIVLADRGYSHANGMVPVIEAGAILVVRWSKITLPLFDSKGNKINVLRQLSKLRLGIAREWTVHIKHQGKLYPLRMCSLKKSQAAARLARVRAMATARKKHRTLQRDNLKLHDYIVILTTLPKQEFSPYQALDLYRGRWQVELAFKKLKTLLKAGHVPKSSDVSARSWMQAKILVALIIERTLHEAKIFSPWGYRCKLDLPLAPRN